MRRWFGRPQNTFVPVAAGRRCTLDGGPSIYFREFRPSRPLAEIINERAGMRNASRAAASSDAVRSRCESSLDS